MRLRFCCVLPWSTYYTLAIQTNSALIRPSDTFSQREKEFLPSPFGRGIEGEGKRATRRPAMSNISIAGFPLSRFVMLLINSKINGSIKVKGKIVFLAAVAGVAKGADPRRPAEVLFTWHDGEAEAVKPFQGLLPCGRVSTL